MVRGISLAALLVLATGTAAGGAEQDAHIHPAPLAAKPGAVPADRNQRLERAENLLISGETEQAQQAFEQAAGLEHAADIELGILRSQMQAGHYRQALAFAAHTAGAHPEVGAGAALYAWLLYLGGQQTFALKILENAEQQLPGDAALVRVRMRLGEFSGNAGHAEKKQLPLVSYEWASYERLMPYSLGENVPAQAQVVGNAVLLNGGKTAITLSPLLNGADSVWLRNGMGRTVQATVQRKNEQSGMVLLSLQDPLDDPESIYAQREAFPGSGAYVFSYLNGTAQQAAWPFTSTGFLGMPRDAATPRPLGIDLPPGAQGAPVLDLHGSLVGIVLPSGEDGAPLLGSIAAMRALAGVPPSVQDTANNTNWIVANRTMANRAVADIYEQALRMALEVIVVVPEQGMPPLKQ